MDLEIFNVNFGDCFILNSADNNMMIDCGSTKAIDPNVIALINHRLKGKKNYLAVTHFHYDHYSGIRSLSGSNFDEVYFPNFFDSSYITLQFAVLFAVSKYNRMYAFAYNLLSSIPGMLGHICPSTKVRFMKRGEIIRNKVGDFRVLWPEPISHYKEKLISADRGSVELVQENDYETLAQKLLKNVPEAQETVKPAAERYYKIISECMQKTEEDSLIFSFDDESLTKLSEILDNFLKNKKDDKIIPREISKEISAFQNKVCLCLDTTKAYPDSIKDADRGPLLFLSDIDHDTFDNIIVPATDGIELAKKYYLIKVPHHGTKLYFTTQLPHSKYLIISNGCVKPSWEASALYSYYYPQRAFICTNYDSACDHFHAAARCHCRALCPIQISHIMHL